MTQAYIYDHESEEDIWIDLPSSTFEKTLENARTLWQVLIEVCRQTDGIVVRESYLVSREEIRPVH